MAAQPGDKVKITTKKETYEGILLPRPETLPQDTITLKLSNGYNIGVKKKNIKTTTVIEKQKTKKETKAKSPAKNAKLKTIAILHTGGTIASKVDYKTGAVIAKFTPEDMLKQMPELKSIVNVKSEMVSNLQSESMRFGHYNLIAKAIQKEIKGKVDGIILTQGTDTLHYTSAALSFMLENLDIPLLIVGAQRSSDRGSGDAFMNIICAAKFIAQTNFSGVAVCMHGTSNDDACTIVPGTKARKMHTSRRDAFRAINTVPYAEVAYKENSIKQYKPFPKKPTGKLTIKLFKENLKVGLLKTHTCTFPEDYAHYKNHDGLIIEGTGLGHAQSKGFDKISAVNEDNKKALAKVAKSIPTIMASQCINGRVNMNVYSPQRELLEIGVVGGEDMTAETAFIKLAWLLSNYKNKDEIKKLMQTNLRGEITDRTVIEENVQC